MKHWVSLFVLLICTNVFGQQGYRYGSSFIELYPDSSSCYYVQTKTLEQTMKFKEMISKNNEETGIIESLGDNAFIVSSKLLGAGNYISYIYKNKRGHKLIILPRFAIKMKDGHEIEEVTTRYRDKLTIDQNEINVYKIDCDAVSSEEVLAINKEINNLVFVDWCEPMMIGEVHMCNEYESAQYYIKNIGQNGGTLGIDINVEPVWDFLTADTTLVVTVLDDGVQSSHEDLCGSVLDGMTIDYPNEYGDPINEHNFSNGNKGHGTACAGIIASRNNTIGTKGVAYGVKILPVNVNPFSSPFLFGGNAIFYEKIGQAITWAYNTKGTDVISISLSIDENSYVSNAITNAMIYGRNGKGTVVVCSAGNNKYNSKPVVFPANMPGTIAIGAIDKNGDIWYYSCRDSTLDIVAPSGDIDYKGDVVTTDRMGSYGYNPPTDTIIDLINTNYTQRFGGTSAACPQVAGVAALMLSANPNLTVSDIRDMLINTTTKLPGMNGFNRTDTYGYGLVNAHSAVLAALKLEVSGLNEPCDTSVYTISNLPIGHSVTWSLSGDNASNFIIQNNTPFSNQCTLLRGMNFMFNGSLDLLLTAQISYNGTEVYTLTKPLTALYIDGDSNPCMSEIYRVKDLASGYRVTWDLSGIGYSLITDMIPTDTLNNNYLGVQRTALNSYAASTITATIWSGSNEVGTLEKRISSGANFSGTWYQSSSNHVPFIPDSPAIELQCEIYTVDPNKTIVLQSDDFIGATMKCNNGNVSLVHLLNSNTARFYTNTANGHSFTVDGYKAGSCEAFRFKFLAIGAPTPEAPFLLGINAMGHEYVFSLTEKQLEQSESEEQQASRSLRKWKLSILNWETGQIVYEGVSDTNTATVNTSGWKSGVYVAVANVNGNNTAQKFTVIQ